MSGTLGIHLVPGASALLSAFIRTDVPLTAPGEPIRNAWPTLGGGYLRLDYKSGDWAGALLFEMHHRGLVRRFRWGSTWVWNTALDPRDRPFASYLDRDEVIDAGPMIPEGHKERPHFERKRVQYEAAARDLFITGVGRDGKRICKACRQARQ